MKPALYLDKAEYGKIAPAELCCLQQNRHYLLQNTGWYSRLVTASRSSRLTSQIAECHWIVTTTAQRLFIYWHSVVQLKCLGISSFMFDMVPFHLLFLILEYVACFYKFVCIWWHATFFLHVHCVLYLMFSLFVYPCLQMLCLYMLFIWHLSSLFCAYLLKQ